MLDFSHGCLGATEADMKLNGPCHKVSPKRTRQSHTRKEQGKSHIHHYMAFSGRYAIAMVRDEFWIENSSHKT